MDHRTRCPATFLDEPVYIVGEGLGLSLTCIILSCYECEKTRRGQKLGGGLDLEHVYDSHVPIATCATILRQS